MCIRDSLRDKSIDFILPVTDDTKRNRLYSSRTKPSLDPVSYTHLDVYKRQVTQLSVNSKNGNKQIRDTNNMSLVCIRDINTIQ